MWFLYSGQWDNIYNIFMEPSYVGDLVSSKYSYQEIIDQYERGLKKGEFYEEPIEAEPFNHIYPDW